MTEETNPTVWNEWTESRQKGLLRMIKSPECFRFSVRLSPTPEKRKELEESYRSTDDIFEDFGYLVVQTETGSRILAIGEYDHVEHDETLSYWSHIRLPSGPQGFPFY